MIYTVIGFNIDGNTLDTSIHRGINNTLEENFNINPLLLIVPLLTIILAVMKMPPLIALLLGAAAGIVAAFIFQGEHYTYQTL